jgi:hypothetical protein
MRSARSRGGAMVAAVLLVVTLTAGLAAFPGPASAAGTGTVTGRVIPTDPANGFNLWCVQLVPVGGGSVVYGDLNDCPLGTGDLSYQMTGVPAGSYLAQVRSYGFGQFAATYGGTPVTVTGGASSVADIAVDNRLGCVEVTVKKAGGVPGHVLHSSQPGRGGTNFQHVDATAQSSVTTSNGCALPGAFVFEVWAEDNTALAARAVAVRPGQTLRFTIDLDQSPQPTLTVSGNPNARTYIDAQTGQSVISLYRGSTAGVTVTFPAPCPGGATPTSVVLQHAGTDHVATQTAPNSGQWQVSILRAQLDSGPLLAVVTCPGQNPVVQTLGRVVLYDPSGYVTNAVTHQPVIGAEVVLFNVPGWYPRTTLGTPGANQCESNTSKAPGAPWTQPAPTGIGVRATAQAAEGQVAPAIDAMVTDTLGHYGWDVAAGCWYVQVTAAGYETLVSPVVGVPPAVTDLDLELQPLPVVGEVPGAPGSVSAVAAKLSAAVSFAPPASDGGQPITAYTVTAAPGGATCIAVPPATSCVVTGLAEATSYTFTVRATNIIGQGAASAVSNAIVPWAGSAFHPVVPSRVLDSRGPNGGWNAPLAAGASRDLKVTELGGPSAVPASASAVVMNVTATGSTAGSFVSVWPAGLPKPVASNLNFAAGQTIPNLVTVKIGAGGNVSFATAVGSVHVIADVVGYFDDGTTAGDLFTGVTPERILDTRGPTGTGPAVAQGTPRALDVRGTAVVPDTATTVVANVTVTGGSAGSFLSVWPSGVAQPTSSNLNFGAGQTIPNLVVIKIGADGKINIANAVGTVHVIVDVVGYFDPSGGARFHAIDPTRMLDSRLGVGLSGSFPQGTSRSLAVAGAAGSGVRADATAVVANVTATEGTTGSFVTIFPDGVDRPTSSNLNFAAGETIPNLTMVKIGSQGRVKLYNHLGSVHLIGDAVGFYAPT